MDFIRKHWLILVAALVAVWYFVTRSSGLFSSSSSTTNTYGVSQSIADTVLAAVANLPGCQGMQGADVMPADQSIYPGYYQVTSAGSGQPAYVNPQTGATFSPGTSPPNYSLSTQQQADLDALGTGQGQAALDTEQQAIDNYDPSAPKSQKIVY